MPERYIKSEPYAWPYNGDLRPENTALVIIDMQTDFCGVGGYVDKMGYDLSLTRAPIEPIQRLLAAMRDQEGLVRCAPPRAERADQAPAGCDARQGLSHHPYPRRPSPRSR